MIAVVGIAAVTWTAFGQGRTSFVRARLSSFQEVPTLSTPGTGEFRGKINGAETELAYELEYSGLVGEVRQAHIHLGARATNGGIMIWLCGTATNPGPAGTPVCPQPDGTVKGTATAANVIGPAGQGVSPGAFADALRALRAGAAYANVHSTAFPPGEIRGQIQDEH
jgi:hypothetical protein